MAWMGRQPSFCRIGPEVSAGMASRSGPTVSTLCIKYTSFKYPSWVPSPGPAHTDS